MSRTTTAFGSREARRARHDDMVRLRARGLDYERIAEKVGLWAGSTVKYHLRGDCHCYPDGHGSERNGARAAEPSRGEGG